MNTAIKVYLKHCNSSPMGPLLLDDDEIIDARVVSPYKLYYKKSGIFCISITAEQPESVEITKKMVKVMGEMVGFKKVPLMSHHKVGAIPTKENRDFWAKAESCPYSSADAFIITSLALRLIANFYLQFNRPERPTKFFANATDATTWLKNYLNVPPVQGHAPSTKELQQQVQR